MVTFHYICNANGLIILSHMLEFVLAQAGFGEHAGRLLEGSCPSIRTSSWIDLQPLRILFGFFPTYRQVAYSSRLNSTFVHIFVSPSLQVCNCNCNCNCNWFGACS